MGNTLVQSIMGSVVLVVAGIFLAFAYAQSDLGAIKGYPLSARFASVGGLPNGGEVRINGIKVGTVVDQKIDGQTFDAIVSMSIKPTVHLPDDTQASIDSEGLLGSKFVKLEPGHSPSFIKEGGVITNTEAYQSLEETVGRIIFLATGSNPTSGGNQQQQPQPQPQPQGNKP